jgi:hypothetical protein
MSAITYKEFLLIISELDQAKKLKIGFSTPSIQRHYTYGKLKKVVINFKLEHNVPLQQSIEELNEVNNRLKGIIHWHTSLLDDAEIKVYSDNIEKREDLTLPFFETILFEMFEGKIDKLPNLEYHDNVGWKIVCPYCSHTIEEDFGEYVNDNDCNRQGQGFDAIIETECEECNRRFGYSLNIDVKIYREEN